eukprot:5892021-Amphidinium_carterae.1
MAHGGPAADPQVSADLSTVRVWHRRILVGKLEWPLPDRDNALRLGRGRGPTRNLEQLAVRLGWIPALGGWTCNGQWFSWDEATLRAKWEAPGLTLRAWLPASRPLLTDSLSWMGRVRRRIGKLPLTLLLEGCGTRNEPTLPSKLHASVAPACVRLHGLLPAPLPACPRS